MQEKTKKLKMHEKMNQVKPKSVVTDVDRLKHVVVVGKKGESKRMQDLT